jgi:hypothetical protein
MTTATNSENDTLLEKRITALEKQVETHREIIASFLQNTYRKRAQRLAVSNARREVIELFEQHGQTAEFDRQLRRREREERDRTRSQAELDEDALGIPQKYRHDSAQTDLLTNIKRLKRAAES